MSKLKEIRNDIICWLIIKMSNVIGLFEKDTYFISFVEEGILNPDYKGYVGGRVEIYDDINSFEVDEIRFFTNKKSWNKFREKWDFKEVTKKQLDSLRKTIEDKYILKG